MCLILNRNSELLVPHVFRFLVMLSYEKFHGKSIIDMPRIIHRCDGIMASGLQPTTHGKSGLYFYICLMLVCGYGYPVTFASRFE